MQTFGSFKGFFFSFSYSNRENRKRKYLNMIDDETTINCKWQKKTDDFIDVVAIFDGNTFQR